MKKFLRRGLITKGLLTLLIVFGAQAATLAASQTILSSVSIEGNDGNYKITLKTNNDIELQSRVPNKDRLILELDNTKSAALIQTKFKNAKNIEDVIVQPINNDKTRLFISGKNIANSQVIIDSTKNVASNDAFAQENAYFSKEQPVQKPVVNEQIEEQAQNNETTSAEEFIANNTSSILEDIDNTKKVETTGAIAAPPEAEVSSNEGSNIEADQTAQSEQPAVSADLFKPAADLELPAPTKAIPEKTTTIKEKPQSAAAVTAKSMKASTEAKSSFFSQPWLLRFGIIFALVTFLVAYIRKENLLGRRPKLKNPLKKKDSLDIYRSLNKGQGSRASSRAASTLDTRLTNRARKAPARANAQPKKATNAVKKFAALQGYKKQSTQQKKAIHTGLSAKRAPQRAPQKSALSQGGYRSTRQKQPASNMDFLQSMAEHYERSGRHDLAMNIQKNIRKTTAKT